MTYLAKDSVNVNEYRMAKKYSTNYMLSCAFSAKYAIYI